MREKSIRYRAPEQLRQRSRREAPKPPSGTTLPIRHRRMAEETARSEPESRGTPSGGNNRRTVGRPGANRPSNGSRAPPGGGPEPGHNDGRGGAQAGNPTERRQPTSEPEGRGTPSGSRAATDDKTARKPRPKRAGTRAQRRPERSLREGTDEKTTEPSPKETAPNKFDMRYSVNAFRIPTRRRPQASTRASPDRPDSRSSAQRSSRRPPRRQAPAACAPRR